MGEVYVASMGVRDLLRGRYDGLGSLSTDYEIKKHRPEKSTHESTKESIPLHVYLGEGDRNYHTISSKVFH